MDLGNQLVVAKDLIHVIFEDLDPVWLKSSWDARVTTYQELIEIVIMLSLVKLRRWCYFKTIISSLYYYFDNQFLTDTFGDIVKLWCFMFTLVICDYGLNYCYLYPLVESLSL